MLTVLLIDTALAQAVAAPSVQLEVGKLVLAIVAGAFSILGTAVIWFIQRLIKSFDGFKVEARGKFEGLSKELDAHSKHVDNQLNDLSQQMQKVSHETFGPNGDNGMRGDLKDTKKLVKKHGRLLVLLAHAAGIKFEEDE